MEELEFDELTSMVLDCADLIPQGKVATYGDIAKIVGTGPRQVGRIMATAGQFTSWWRVVRSDGGSQVAGTARSKWAEENIAFSELSAPKVRMQQHRLSEEELETIAGKLQQIAD
ncbi:putative methylated-DNA-protein-cysteine methyltransferase [Corynebacterium glutamicum MB001]|uniref:Predicted methylated DNA-protein cysteine methyltransferase n=2 Tax=Corynebacterium TaxID=1716 RepID=Q8NU02_CORGL|nr:MULTISPECIES: MGMT family protein [Corynebacterium]AGT04159.1 putative methylated-DNA-protein-cysteine methyltransferase [Corynebacterium glutamicum MB001]AIK83885.1 cysteine methyltransferase [Corynebacterium glutamicum]AIK86646.1 cysteine methyltransferase [Corynebacterium glutamicum]AKF26209.1 cysteine methyltransferase [[Brevibacterium] flavum]ALP48906.1 cysteine methyltransferase [Corynebacterium glutamicum]